MERFEKMDGIIRIELRGLVTACTVHESKERWFDSGDWSILERYLY